MTGFALLASRLSDFPPDRRYLVGVSGGRDSVALLHWLVGAGYRHLVVCHLDHGLRGRAARADAEFVRRLTKQWKLPCVIKRVDVASKAAAARRSIETSARHERLEFFSQAARRRHCGTIFLGHHADDQVETFLLQLLRGAGGRGLGAMRAVSQHASLQIVRPFLGIWRSEIDRYVAEHGLKFREDATNATTDARRNRLRHTLIPALEKELDRNVRRNLWRTANVLAEEDALLEQMVPAGLVAADSLGTKALGGLPVPLQRRVILQWLRRHEIRDLSYDAVELVRSLLGANARPAKVNLPGDRHARRRAGKIFLE